MLGCTTMNTAYEEIISANTVVRYDICPFQQIICKSHATNSVVVLTQNSHA